MKYYSVLQKNRSQIGQYRHNTIQKNSTHYNRLQYIILYNAILYYATIQHNTIIIQNNTLFWKGNCNIIRS